jgi:hypothetical protein
MTNEATTIPTGTMATMKSGKFKGQSFPVLHSYVDEDGNAMVWLDNPKATSASQRRVKASSLRF